MQSKTLVAENQRMDNIIIVVINNDEDGGGDDDDDYDDVTIMLLGHLLNHSGLTHPEISSVVFPDSFCLLVCSFLLSREICYEAFYLHVISNYG